MSEGPLADPRKVGRKKIEERFARRTELADIGLVLSTLEGRRFMWRLLKSGHIFESCFTSDNRTFYNEGRRDLAAQFLADTQRFPQLYLKMVEENQPSEEPEEPRKKQDDDQSTLDSNGSESA